MAELSLTARPVTVAGLLTEEVETETGQRVGFIKDLIIEPASGAMAFAVLSVGGLFGIGSKLYAVPWRLFEWTHNTPVLRNARQVLAHAARWDEDQGIVAAHALPSREGDIGPYSNRN